MSMAVAFQFEGNDVRTYRIKGLIWFVLADVCRVLEIANSRHAAKRLDDDEKDDVVINDAIGREQSTTIINESGLYSLILTSRKMAAKRFKKWVTAEVLPALRATGRYEIPRGPDSERAATGNLAKLPVSERNYQLSVVREARATFGERAARRVWGMSGVLPDLADIADQEEVSELSRMRASDCLMHLLRNNLGDGVVITEMIMIAQYMDNAKVALEQRGIRVNPARYSGKVIFAADHPFLNRMYAGTDWAGIYWKVLGDLPGARVTRHKMQFGDHAAKGVVVSLSTVNNAGGW